MDWIKNLKLEVPKYLSTLKSSNIKGFYKYSLSGDIYPESPSWGLGNTVFAAKIYYTLDMIDSLTENQKDGMSDFIKSFQRKDGSIYDGFVVSKSFFYNLAASIKNLDFGYTKKSIDAQTRQSFSALDILGSKADIEFTCYPKSKIEVEHLFSSLDWSKPWGSASHISHFLYFLKLSKEKYGFNESLFNEIVQYTLDNFDKIQSDKDGAWYKGSGISIGEKINGAMKVLTALKVIGKASFKYPDKLIDLSLSASNDRHACDNLNILYVLKYANELADYSYRYQEISEFCSKRLELFRDYYFQDKGGFSFYIGRPNRYYYRAKINKGFNEPDIHGTMLFMWGISLIEQILNKGKGCEFNEFVP